MSETLNDLDRQRVISAGYLWPEHGTVVPTRSELVSLVTKIVVDYHQHGSADQHDAERFAQMLDAIYDRLPASSLRSGDRSGAPMERDTSNVEQTLTVWGEWVSAQCREEGKVVLHFPRRGEYLLSADDADTLAILFRAREKRRMALAGDRSGEDGKDAQALLDFAQSRYHGVTLDGSTWPEEGPVLQIVLPKGARASANLARTLADAMPAAALSRREDETSDQLRRDLDSANDQIASIAAALGLDEDDDTPLLHVLEQRLAGSVRAGDRDGGDDTERLDWLEEHFTDAGVRHVRDGVSLDPHEGRIVFPVQRDYAITGWTNVRELIDTAMESTPTLPESETHGN